jgi:hypothetical protein
MDTNLDIVVPSASGRDRAEHFRRAPEATR